MEEDEEVVEVVLFLLVVELAVEGLEVAIEAVLEAMSEAVKIPTPKFGIISSRLVPFVSGTKASENRKPKVEMMAYVQNVPWRPRLSWRSTNVLTPTNAQT